MPALAMTPSPPRSDASVIAHTRQSLASEEGGFLFDSKQPAYHHKYKWFTTIYNTQTKRKI